MLLFNTSKFLFSEVINKNQPWTSLEKIESYINKRKNDLLKKGYQLHAQALIHESVKIDHSAKIEGLALIGPNTEIRDGALLRKGVIIGENCKIGHATEVKHSILLNHVSAGHFNYIGDSIVGNNVNFGAGSILANLKSGARIAEIKIEFQGKKIDTKLSKLGSMIGDNVKIGSNSVLNPGTIVGKNSVIYPLSLIRGTIPSNKIVKSSINLEIVDRE